MDLLEKFGQIDVKVDNRISEYDRQFCQAHQTAYEKAREFIKRMADEVDKAQVEQYSILKAYNKDSPSFLGSGYHNEFDSKAFWDRLDKTHDCFIARLVSYFAHKYNVTLDDDSDAKSSLRKFLDKLYLSNGNANNMRVYHHHVYLFRGNKLITIIDLPQNLCKLADQIQKQKDGGRDENG